MKIHGFCRTIGAAALVSVASAASGPGAQAQVTLDFWSEFSSPPQSTTMNSIVDDFNKANPDILVKHTGFENTPYETTLKTGFAGGNPADIVEINGGANMFQYARAGGLIDLTDFMKQFKSVIAPGVNTTFEYQGKAYGIPWSLSIGNILWYNSDMLKANNIDPDQLKTWKGFLAAAKSFKDAGIVPIAFGNKETWPGNFYYTFLMRRLLTDEQYRNLFIRTLDPSIKSELKFTDPIPVKVWELYKDLADKGYFTAGYLADDTPTAEGLFLNSVAPFYLMGSWFNGQVAGQQNPQRFGASLFPVVEGGPGKQTDLIMHDDVITITTASKHPDEAKKFLAFLASEPVQRKFAEGNQEMVPYTYDTSGWKLSDGLKRTTALYAASTGALPFSDMIEDQGCNWEWTSTASVGVLTGDLTPQQAGEQHEECVQKLTP